MPFQGRALKEVVPLDAEAQIKQAQKENCQITKIDTFFCEAAGGRDTVPVTSEMRGLFVQRRMWSCRLSQRES
jgi:hypothetical protein